MLFITNRTPRQSIRSRRNRKIDFDLNNNAPSNSIYFCLRKGENDYAELGGLQFLQQLRQSKARQILILLHGFSNLPEPHIFPRALELQALFDEKEKGLVQVVPLVWPCDNDRGIVKDYWDDQKSADQSAYAFARLLEMFLAWRNDNKQNPQDDPCLKRINVLAHSMGNRVLRETLQVWDRYDLAGGVPMLFRNTFLVAADIVNESLEPGNSGDSICHASRNVCVYFASDDLALRSSKAANLKNRVASRRLGHSGPEDMGKTPKNVFAIDCDDFNNSYDAPKGHSYFLRAPDGQPGKVFEHIFRTVKLGRVFPSDEQRRSVIL